MVIPYFRLYSKSLAGLVSITLIGMIIGRVFRFGMTFVIGSVVGPTTLGVFSVGIVIIQTGSVVSSLGLQKANQRVISVQRERSGVEVRGTLLASVFTPLLVGGVLAAILLYSWPLVASFWGFRGSHAQRLFIYGIPLFALINVTAFGTRGFGETKYFVYIKELSQSGTAFLLVSAAALVVGDIQSIAVSYLLSLVIGSVLSLYFVYNLGNFASSVEFSVNMRKLFSISIPLMVIVASSYLMTWTDTLVIAIFRSPEVVGFYQSAYMFAALAPFAFQAINSVFPHLAAKFYANGQMEELVEVYETVTLWGVCITAIVVSFYAVFGTELLSLYGPRFLVATDVLVILSIGYLLSVLSGPASYMLSMSEFERVEASNALLFGGLNLLLNIIIVPTAGMVGAAIATSFSLAAMNFARIGQVYYFLKIHPYNRKYLRSTLALFISIVGLNVSSILQGKFISMFMAVIVSGILFMVTMYYLGIIEDSEILWKAVT